MQREDLLQIRDTLAATLPPKYEPLLLKFYGREAREAGDDVIIGDDFRTELHLTAEGAVVSIDPKGKLPRRFMNSSVGHLAEFLKVVSRTDRSDVEREREMWRKLTDIDPRAFADQESWWAVVLEQVRLEAGWEGGDPVKIIERLAAAYDAAADDQVLASIAALAPLADEADTRWESKEYWRTAAYPFLALADLAAKRRLKPAVRLLLERACYGDPGEIMRGLRHTFEAIYKPDWTTLADEYLALARAECLGTRLWAIDSLIVIDDPRAVPVFEASVRGDPEEIRWRAEIGLERLLYPEQIAAEAAQEHAKQERARQERLDRQAEADARMTDRRCAACDKPLPSYRRTCKHCGAAAI